MVNASHTEKELLLLLREGDHNAFSQLYHQYAKPLYWKMLSMVKESTDADEILQELFVKVWEKRDQINIQQSFEAYLYRMAQHMAVDYFRALSARSRLHARVVSDANRDAVESSEETYLANETRELLNQLIAKLPAQRRRAFMLCKMEGKSHREAAEIMGISPNTVHNHLVKALSEIKSNFEKSGLKLSHLILLLVLSPLTI